MSQDIHFNPANKSLYWVPVPSTQKRAEGEAYLKLKNVDNITSQIAIYNFHPDRMGFFSKYLNPILEFFTGRTAIPIQMGSDKVWVRTNELRNVLGQPFMDAIKKQGDARQITMNIEIHQSRPPQVVRLQNTIKETGKKNEQRRQKEQDRIDRGSGGGMLAATRNVEAVARTKDQNFGKETKEEARRLIGNAERTLTEAERKAKQRLEREGVDFNQIDEQFKDAGINLGKMRRGVTRAYKKAVGS